MSYTLEIIFQYLEDELNTYLRNQRDDPNKYPSLKEKRYMTVYYLSENGDLKQDTYTQDPKFSEYLLKSQTWDDFKNIFMKSPIVSRSQKRDISKDEYEIFLDACREGNLNLVNVYLQKHDVQKLLDYGYDKPALTIASMHGHTEIVKLLLATEESHPEYQDKADDNMTALMYASKNYDAHEIVKLLLDTGKSHPEYRNDSGITALMLAAGWGSPKNVKFLLDSGESHPEYKDDNGTTALMYASSTNGRDEIVELLLKTGESHPEYQDQFGVTALIIASTKRRFNIVELLLNSGQSHPEAKDDNGRTALEWASTMRYPDIVKLIEEYLLPKGKYAGKKI